MSVLQNRFAVVGQLGQVVGYLLEKRLQAPIRNLRLLKFNVDLFLSFGFNVREIP